MTAARAWHYPALLAAVALLTLPNLGATSLWDMDEGVNAGCAREMLEAGTWVVPTFNWELRTAKPVLLYWLQRFSYQALGVSEFSARLPSALLAFVTVLTTYELARRMFDALTGLLAGVVLASAIQFCVLSHAATPDAPLIAFSTLTFWLIWVYQERGGRGWLVWPALPCGLAVLSKGPIGLAGPGLAACLFFVWNREWRRLFDAKLLAGLLLFAVVVAPWVALVASETRGEWLFKFLQNENVNRLTSPQENHGGPVVYYILCILALFAPWSSVIGGVAWQAGRVARLSDDHPEARPIRFLLSWLFAYLVPFSLAATKLPNYVGPLYPALAILTAWLLVRWLRGQVTLARWLMPTATACVALTGVAFAAGFLLAGGAFDIEVKGLRVIPGLAPWAALGLIPLAGAAAMAWGLWRGRRDVVVIALALAAVGLVGGTAAGPVLAVDRQKAAKELVLSSGARQPGREIRVAAVQYFQDSQSIVFYAERRVEVLASIEQVQQFLTLPRPGYLFIPEALWVEQFADKPGTPPCRVAARRYDLYRNAVILVVTTDGG